MTSVTRTRVTALVVRPRGRGGGGAGEGLIPLDALARAAGLHPALVRRVLALGAVEPAGGTRAAPLFAADAPARLARVIRLRRDLGLNYAGAVLACELLARIERLERPWTRAD
jgi:hypothetical protein